MVTRLSAADASFFGLENSATPMYVCSLSILKKPRNGLSYETLLETVEQRLPQIPRYRQKVREVTLGLARPVWVDDRDFDITYHVRRSALPSPGSDAQLHELVARLGSRALDKSRPLWEMYLVEGLAGNRLALYTKSHQALVNGMTAVEIGHVIADRTQKPPPFGEDIWIPAREPSDTSLTIGAIGEWIARPGAQLAAVRSTVTEVATNSGELLDLGKRFTAAAKTFARGTAPSSPLNTKVSRNRRFTVASAKLEDYRNLRRRYDCDVNDVVLAVVAGTLRNWLLSRGEPVAPTATVRAMAPMSVYPDDELDSSGPGQAISEVAPFLLDLPVGEGNAVVRLSQIAHMTEIPSDGGKPRRRKDHRHAVRFRAADLARHGNPGGDHIPGPTVQPADHQCARRPEADVCRRHEASRDLRRTAPAEQSGARDRHHVLQRHALFRDQRRP